MKFEEKIIKLRKENGLSQEDLGEKLNVTRQTISKWELGQTKPDADKLMEMARLFNVSTDELLNDSDEKTETKEKVFEDKQNDKRNTIIVIVLVAILALVLMWVGSSLLFGKAEEGILSKFFGTFDRALNIVDNTIEQVQEDQERFEEEYNRTQNTINERKQQIKDSKEKVEQKSQEINEITDDEKFNELYNQALDEINKVNEKLDSFNE